MIVFSHPTGNANVRQAALALHESGQLDKFWTCLAPSADDWWVRLLPSRLATQFLRRCPLPAIRKKMRSAPGRELGRLAAGSMGWSSLTRHERGIFSVDAVYRSLDRRVSREFTGSASQNARDAYAYEDGARETFRRCREHGGKCFYDLPIGYWRVWRALLEEERVREPEWVTTLQGAADSDEKLARKDDELRLADRVFVASSFTRKTLDAAPAGAADIHVIPYGSPRVSSEEPKMAGEGPLRVLFAGALSQRKGLSYLLEAVRQLGRHVELTLIGMKLPGKCAPLDRALREHRWIPSLPHEEVLREMRRHDVFVFPSLFEGFGLVILEAMSQGVPVITTPHTAGPDLIEEGRSGFIVPIRSAPAIADRLHLLAGDRALLAAMKRAAWAAAAALKWSDYRTRLAALVAEIASPNQSQEVAA